jgi:hypothetical protein
MQNSYSATKTALWVGRVMSALPVLMILFGSILKLMKSPSIIEGCARAGISEHLIVPIGVIEMLCVVLYAVPRTAILGAILMTGLLGGATITNLRINDPSYPLPVILGLLAWGGLFLRDLRLRELIPLRKI